MTPWDGISTIDKLPRNTPPPLEGTPRGRVLFRFTAARATVTSRGRALALHGYCVDVSSPSRWVN